MPQLNAIYKCNVCGNITAMIHASTGQLVCCGQNMELKLPSTEDQGAEKHVPVVEKTETGIKVKVGEVLHPMEDDHSIEWIEVLANGKSYRQFLNPGDQPEAEFCVQAEKFEVREYCNLHGLWQTSQN